jgi:hypothetical protein
MSRILAAALLLAAALPAGAQIKWGDQFDEITCGQWEPLDMTGRIEKLKAIEPFGEDLEQADRGAAEQWEAEVAAACKGHPDRPLRDAATQALGPT